MHARCVRDRLVVVCDGCWAIGPTGETRRRRERDQERSFSGGDRALRAVPSSTDHPSRPAYAGRTHGPKRRVLTYTITYVTVLHLHTCQHARYRRGARAHVHARLASIPTNPIYTVARKPSTTGPLMNEPIHPIGLLRPRATSPTSDRLRYRNFISARTHDSECLPLVFGVWCVMGLCSSGSRGLSEMVGLLFVWVGILIDYIISIILLCYYSFEES